MYSSSQKTIKIIVALLIIVFLYSCNNNSDTAKPHHEAVGDNQPVDSKPPGSVSDFEKSWIKKHVKSGMVVADIGCGGGRLTFLFGKEVGKEGKVFALDIDEKVLIQIKHKAVEKKLNKYDNVVVIKNTLTDTLLKPSSVDLSFVVASLWHARYPLEPDTKKMLKSVYDTTKPGGKLHVINGPFPVGEKINNHETESIVKNFQEAGFVLEKEPLIKERTRVIKFIKQKN